MSVDVLTLDGVFDLGLAAILDAYQTANELVQLSGLEVEPFDVRVVGVRRRVTTSHGLTVPVHRLPARPAECVVVPAIGFKMPDALEAALARPDVQDAADALRQWSRRTPQIAAACIGTFVLAESGLLDGERATTTWWLSPMFRQRYPSVRLEETQMVVPSGRFVTSGAALSRGHGTRCRQQRRSQCAGADAGADAGDRHRVWWPCPVRLSPSGTGP